MLINEPHRSDFITRDSLRVSWCEAPNWLLSDDETSVLTESAMSRSREASPSLADVLEKSEEGTTRRLNKWLCSAKTLAVNVL